MTANLTPEHVSEVAEEIAATLPPDPAGGFAGTEFDPQRDVARIRPGVTIASFALLDQDGNIIVTQQLSAPVVASGGMITFSDISFAIV